MVRKRLVRTRLESGSIAASRGIEKVDASEDTVRIFARASATGVRQSVRTSPVGLQETEDEWRLRVAVGA